MRPLAVQGDADAVPGGENRTYLSADLSGWVRQHVLRERDIWLRDTVAQTALDHRLRATTYLFRGLEQRDEGSAPRLSSLGEQFRRAQQTCHMGIMAAGMCDADCVPRVINSGNLRSVGQLRVFPHGKRVHVGSREYGLASTVAQDADDSSTTD